MFFSKLSRSGKGATPRVSPERPRVTRRGVECYCGGYEACAQFRMMTPAQRAACSEDKRMTAQRMWKGGM